VSKNLVFYADFRSKEIFEKKAHGKSWTKNGCSRDLKFSCSWKELFCTFVYTNNEIRNAVAQNDKNVFGLMV
jgi:hypothetical protein